MRKKKLSGSVVTISCLALVVGGFAVALVALRTTSLPKLLDIEVVGGLTTDPTANDGLKAQLAQESSTVDSLKQQLSTSKERTDAKEAAVSSLEVKSKEDELDFTKVGKDIVFNFLQTSLQQRRQLTSAIGEFRAELVAISKLLDSVSIVKSKIAASEARFKAKEGEFKQALRQRLSVTKELALYFLTLKFVWGLFTGYARTHYPYQQRDLALRAAERFEQESKQLNQELVELKSELEARIRALEALAVRVSEVVAKQQPTLSTYFNVNLLEPLQSFIASIDGTRAAREYLEGYKTRVEIMRRDGAPFNPQFTPGAYVKTVGQAFFKFEENHFKEREETFDARLTELQDQGLVDIVKRLTSLLNSFELRVNQFGFLPNKLDLNPTVKK